MAEQILAVRWLPEPRSGTADQHEGPPLRDRLARIRGTAGRGPCHRLSLGIGLRPHGFLTDIKLFDCRRL
jgi:hypothetical protein